MLILCIPTLPGCRDEMKKPGYGYLMLPKVVKFKKSVDQLSPVRLCLGRLLQGNINKISVEGLLARGVNHSLEIPGNPYKKSEISYAKCWSGLPLVLANWYPIRMMEKLQPFRTFGTELWLRQKAGCRHRCKYEKRLKIFYFPFVSRWCWYQESCCF